MNLKIEMPVLVTYLESLRDFKSETYACGNSDFHKQIQIFNRSDHTQHILYYFEH